LVALVAAYAASAFTESQPPPPPPQPTFRTEANYVRVDVYPTKDGAPVVDLRQEDFEVFESGVPQKIEQFERVVVRAAGPQETRVEPSTVAESRAMVQNPRARVFVLFLDVNHVDVGGSHNIRKPLVEALDRVIGQEDLIGVMTPEMSASDVTFARKTITIDGMLSRYWYWGERDQISTKDPRDDQYRACYPGVGPNIACPDDDRGVADEMIERRREKETVDALQDLVRYLRGTREERKAVLAISDGWRLFGPNPRLARRLYCSVPQAGDVGVDPRTGKLTTRTPTDPVTGVSPDACERDRQTLAYMDDARQFRDVLDEANRANVSFYPIDPRGLPVFDESIGKSITGRPAPGTTRITPPSVDAARLTARIQSLRTLAEATDGLAIVNSNDLARGLRRVVDDLSSYYLLGYYSNGQLDGKFHSITVRVKRPGVQVRARRGYLAATVGAATAAARNATAPSAADAETMAIEAAVALLASFGRDVPVRILAAAGWTPRHTAAVWVTGEVAASDEWRAGADADVLLVNAAGETVTTAHASVAPGGRWFRVALMPAQPLAAGDYTVRVRARAAGATTSTNEVLSVKLPVAPQASGAVLLRRGPSTGNHELPTADRRFQRTDQLRLELPTAEDRTVTARLLDRTGKPLPIPVAASVRDDQDGSRWASARLALAPLAVGDYVIEVSGSVGRTLVAFRVVP
jgi:VWFA-related protein